MAGLPDPRCLKGSQAIDPRISRLLASYKKSDPSPSRLQPIPLSILHHACDIAEASGDASFLAASDLIWTAFFFLLRPGEYMENAPDAHPFTLADVRLWVNGQQIDPLSAPIESLRAATFVALTFTEQKNAVRGEAVGHGKSGHAHACPVNAIVRRIEHLRSHHAPPTTALCAVGPSLKPLETTKLTQLLQQGALVYAASTSNPPPLVHLKALRATGATALLGRNVQTDEIKLLGRWKSDAMIRYLHLQSQQTMSHYSGFMLRNTHLNSSH
jgi:hypothetical protein